MCAPELSRRGATRRLISYRKEGQEELPFVKEHLPRADLFKRGRRMRCDEQKQYVRKADAFTRLGYANRTAEPERNEEGNRKGQMVRLTRMRPQANRAGSGKLAQQDEVEQSV
eukprot:4775357-Pleurochrysis_carterae.AAC.6